MDRTDVKLLLVALPFAAFAIFVALQWPALVGILVAGFVALALRNHPRASLGVWLAVLACVPFWLTVRAGAQWPPATVAAVMVLPAVLVKHPDDERIRAGDLLLSAAVLANAIVVFAFGAPSYTVRALILQGVTAYFVGRRLSVRAGEQWTINAVAVTTAGLALWSVVELLTGWHAFENLMGSPDLSFWRTIQFRGALARSEAAWGHAIALGAMLSLGLPFVFRSTLRFRGALTLLVLAGTVCTFSRGPIIGAFVGFGMCLVFVPSISPARRLATAAAVVAIGVVVLPKVLAYFGTVSGELDATSGYRVNLLRYAPDDLHLVGRADYVATMPDGTLRYRGFGSIDNAFLLIALDVGIIVTSLLALGLFAAAWRTLRRRGGPADAALAAQIVVLSTVAMITQYQAAVFFVAGVSVGLARLHQPTGHPSVAEPRRSDARPPLTAASLGP